MSASGKTPKLDDPRGAPRLTALPLLLRIAVLLVGWVLVLIGIVGLALPGIQGCVTIALGAALLSLASELIYRGLKKLLHRWPKIWSRVESLRAWVHGKLTRSGDSSGGAAPP